MDMPIAEIVSTYKDFGYGGLLIVLVVFSVKYLYRENQKCYTNYEAQLTAHKNEIKSLTEKMYSVIEEHTKASISLNTSIKEIFRRNIS